MLPALSLPRGTSARVNFGASEFAFAAANRRSDDTGVIRSVWPSLVRGCADGSASGDADDSGVSAAGAGNVLLDARGSASDVVLAADVNGGAGNVNITADNDVTFDATSGITANPAVGRAFDLLIEQGATGIFEATGELQ